MTTPTPIIELNSATEIKWTNAPINPDPNGLNFSVRVDIYKGTSFLRREDIFAVADLILLNLASGDYKIKFKLGWDGEPDSEFSNVVNLASQVSGTPTITSYDNTVTNGTASVVLGGVSGAELYYVRNTEQPQFIGNVPTNGVKNYSHSNGGSYKYFQIETGKSQSEFTNTIQITDSTMQSCANGNEAFSIFSANYDKATRILRFQFNASGLSLGNWTVKALGSNVTTAQGNFSPTTNVIDLGMPDLADGTFVLEIVGVSCTGTTSKNFTVATVVNENCETPTGSISANKISYGVGETATLTVAGLSNQTSIQWGKNGILINQTGNTLTLSNLALSQNGDKYQLYIENNCGGGKTKTSILTNEITLNVQASTPTTKRYIVPAKMDSVCASEVIQIGCCSTTQVQPSVWVDADLTKMLVSNGGVTSEVTSGGVAYQAKSYDLPAGTYYFYARQKTATSNVVYIGSLVVTI